MEKISITVRIPALDNTYDFIVPNNMPVQNIQNLIVKILSSEYGISTTNNDVMLFDTSDNKALRLECSFAQLGISEGAKLLML
ncbi:EsaB/YukD family protein [Pseudoflavonifractor sp. An44]|uniref:EsaB/YukD family protein n=1 Tax=Pseudoflavonifractor sp. An44 TaxID=1965635 RepID=UPI00117A4296|nr:EsaB/YukD family protein [Pseudoflavonifractor sp. An44]